MHIRLFNDCSLQRKRYANSHPLNALLCVTPLFLCIVLLGCVFIFPQNSHALQITEIMYNPKGKDVQYEFIELYNETASQRDVSGWAILGTHVNSHIVGAAPQDGKKCLRLVAHGTGNTATNHIEVPTEFPLKNNEMYTISFWAKWQWGSNLLVTRCLNNQLAETHRIPTPELTGTPGRQNSVYRANLGPVFHNVRHSPVIPNSADTVHIIARLWDADGIGEATLYYKADTKLSYAKTVMYDDGKHADGETNDGIYGGEIPPFSADETVAFYIKANDGKDQSNTWPRDLKWPGLYRIEDIEPDPKHGIVLPSYRIVMTGEDARESDVVWEDILPPGKRYLSIFYPNDSSGQLFEIGERFAFYGSPEDTGNFEPMFASFEWLGTGKNDLYRWNYQLRNREQTDDFNHLIRLLKVMNETSDEQYQAAVAEIINVEEWLRVMAVRALVSDWDFLGTTLGKNAYIYYRDDGKWDLLSWDNEWGFEQQNMSIWSSVPTIRRFQESPKHQHLYWSMIRELMSKYFNMEHLGPWIKHYHGIVGGVSPEQIEAFIRGRTDYVNRIMPKSEAEITNENRIADGNTIELEGTAPVQTRFVKISEVVHELDWVGVTQWKLTLSGIESEELTVEFLDYDQKRIATDSVQLPTKQ